MWMMAVNHLVTLCYSVLVNYLIFIEIAVHFTNFCDKSDVGFVSMAEEFLEYHNEDKDTHNSKVECEDGIDG